MTTSIFALDLIAGALTLLYLVLLFVRPELWGPQRGQPFNSSDTLRSHVLNCIFPNRRSPFAVEKRSLLGQRVVQRYS
jgi:hypothetical protein